MPLSPYPLAVVYQASVSHPQIEPMVIELAQRLSLPLSASWAEFSHSRQEGFVLLLNEQGLALQQLGKKAPGPIRVDFEAGAVAHRRKFGGGSGQMIAKAVGVKASRPLHVLDATAGLGKDAFVLASLGCVLTLHERNPVVAELLADGLRRGRQAGDPELATILERMSLLACDSLEGMVRDQPTAVVRDLEIAPVDIVYLDPMFPDRSKSASVKKDMAVFHQVVGKDEDADELLPLARSVAQYRVVVKRPRKAPFLNAETPTYQLSGKTSRYDIYVNKKLPD